MPKKPFKQLTKWDRKKLMQACFRQFAGHGYANTGIKMIARQLKVADGYLYYYFHGKEDLVRWLIDEGTELWKAHFTAHVDAKEPKDLFDLFRLSVLAMSDFIKKHRAQYGTYFQFVNEPDFPLAEHMVKKTSWIDRVFQKALEEEIKAGRLRSDIQPELAAALLEVVNSRLQEFMYNPRIDPIGVAGMDEKQLGRLADNLILIFRNGLAA